MISHYHSETHKNRYIFIQEIQYFEKEYGKLEDCLNKNNPEIIEALLSNPVIHRYLARDVNQVEFNEHGPILLDGDPNTSDHYELKIYRLLPHIIPYRHDRMNEFYSWGIIHLKLHERIIENLNQCNPDVIVNQPSDIYGIAKKLQYKRDKRLFSMNNDNTYPRFVLDSNWKDGHSSCVISIFDPVNHKILCSLLLNSFQDGSFYDVMDIRYNQTMKFSSFHLRSIKEIVPNFYESTKNYFNTMFSFDIDNLKNYPATKLTNEKIKAVCFINTSRICSKEFHEALENPDLEYVFNLGGTLGPLEEDQVEIYSHQQVPLIDASHHLQTHKDDKNCGLYTLAFVQNIVNVLHEPEIADEVYELAKALNRGDEKAKEKLILCFQEISKSCLSDFYHGNTLVKKSERELIDFFIKTRWKLGAQGLTEFYPVNNAIAYESRAYIEYKPDSYLSHEQEISIPVRNNKQIQPDFIAQLPKFPKISLEENSIFTAYLYGDFTLSLMRHDEFMIQKNGVYKIKENNSMIVIDTDSDISKIDIIKDDTMNTVLIYIDVTTQGFMERLEKYYQAIMEKFNSNVNIIIFYKEDHTNKPSSFWESVFDGDSIEKMKEFCKKSGIIIVNNLYSVTRILKRNVEEFNPECDEIIKACRNKVPFLNSQKIIDAIKKAKASYYQYHPYTMNIILDYRLNEMDIPNDKELEKLKCRENSACYQVLLNILQKPCQNTDIVKCTLVSALLDIPVKSHDDKHAHLIVAKFVHYLELLVSFKKMQIFSLWKKETNLPEYIANKIQDKLYRL